MHLEFHSGEARWPYIKPIWRIVYNRDATKPFPICRPCSAKGKEEEEEDSTSHALAKSPISLSLCLYKPQLHSGCPSIGINKQIAGGKWYWCSKEREAKAIDKERHFRQSRNRILKIAAWKVKFYYQDKLPYGIHVRNVAEFQSISLKIRAGSNLHSATCT